jgi:glutathione synthase/RimK-type ligase-like ATP-grasp enzyme
LSGALGLGVTEAHDLDAVRSLDLSDFDVCLPRFRVSAAHMTSLDEALVESGVPMLNSRDTRWRCENKALAHLAFEAHGIAQPPSFVWSADGVRGERRSSNRSTAAAAVGSRSAAP